MLAELLAAAVAVGTWQSGPPLPIARTEVAGAAVRGEIFIVGGYLANGSSSRRVDVYSPRTQRWRRASDLPVAVNHAMAASYRGRLYVVGGYSGSGAPLRSAYVLRGRRWQRLRPMPAPRAAAAAVVAKERLYVFGGVERRGSLAQIAFVLDLRRLRWSRVSGPTPREHLAGAALRGRIYAVAGRLGGLDSNQSIVEFFMPDGSGIPGPDWKRVPGVPEPRGGTGAAAAGGRLISAGGEAPTGTVASVFAYEPDTHRWERLPDLPTPRHGLAVVGIGSRVYAIGGGPRPGLFVSAANESLDLRGG